MLRNVVIALLGLLLSRAVLGTTYTYVGPTYTSAASPYTTAMSITGTFDTAAPLPTNMNPYVNIGPGFGGSGLVTGWSFFDGVNTYTQANSSPSPFPFWVTTDALGNVTSFVIELTSPLPPIAINDVVNVIIFGGAYGSSAIDAATCNVVDIAHECMGTISAPSGSAPTTGAFTPNFTALPPTISKAFGAPSVPLNWTTSLDLTLTNPNPTVALSGLAFTDALPAGLTAPNGTTATCGGSLAITGGNLLTFSGGTLTGGASCTITVVVTGASMGAQNNTTSVVTASGPSALTGTPSNTATVTIAAAAAAAGIPALGPWMMALLAVLLAWGGVCLARR